MDEAPEPAPAPAPEPTKTTAESAAVFGDRLALAERYAGWLVGPGIERGLIGPREAARIWTRHVLNSAVVAPLLPAGGRIVDVGSGAGLPGIPIAIARPDLIIALVEPLERRTVFLAEAVAALGLTNCTVIRGRADEVVAQCGGSDVVTSRAVAPLAKLAGWCVPLLRPGGEIVALKGASAADEIARDSAILARLGLVDVRLHTVGSGQLTEPTTVVRATLSAAPRQAVPKRRRGSQDAGRGRR